MVPDQIKRHDLDRHARTVQEAEVCNSDHTMAGIAHMDIQVEDDLRQLSSQARDRPRLSM